MYRQCGQRILKIFLLIVITAHLARKLSAAQMRLTNVDCTAYDEPFAAFQTCRLNIVSRGTIALNIHVKLYQIPVNNVTINLEILKRANGYRPFLYNYTVDFCQFMRNRNKNPMLRIFFDILLHDSNINHTCPYNHDIIVKNLVILESHLQLLPLPEGQYMFILNVGAYNSWKARVRVYLIRNE